MPRQRRGGGDPGRQSSLPSNLRSLLIDNPEHGGQSDHPEASTSGEPRAGWDPSSRAFRPVPSFPDPDYNVGSLAPAAFDEGDRRIGDLPRRGPAEPIETYSDDPYLRRPAAPQLPPLQSILPGGTSPTEPALPPPRSVHGYPQHLSLPPPEPPRLPTLRPYWEGQAGPSSQPQRLPPARHGYSYPMPQAHEPAAPYSHPPPQLTPVSSSFPPPGSRYGGHHELGGEYPVASSSRQPLQPYPESYSFPQPGPSRAYEAGRGRIPEARSEYGSPTLGYLRRHLEPEGGGHPDDPRRGRSLPPRRSAGASGSRPLPSRLLEPEDRGLYPLPHAPPLPYSRGSPVTAERPGEGERQLSPVEFRTRPGSRRSVSPSERRTALPIPEAERPPLQSKLGRLSSADTLLICVRWQDTKACRIFVRLLALGSDTALVRPSRSPSRALHNMIPPQWHPDIRRSAAA
ncbi:uncharacterized protein B0H18DRAFT_973645, partial [Fomitopsis serialis]|uniref:uncharacterized protein n=1 Tax=Fomitopsis serialis TaxID=139415 RepID=UPI002008C1EE